MARKRKSTKPPKLGRTPAQEKVWLWVLREYFSYIDEKQKLGGFPTEWHLRLGSRAIYAPDLDAATLKTELIGQYGAAVWQLDPALRPSLEAPEDEDETTVEATDAEEPGREHDLDGEAVDAAEGEGEAEPPKRDSDLFTVAGVTLPASCTMPDASVPEGYRRVGRRWVTWRIYDLHVSVEEAKAAESVAKSQSDRDNCAKMFAAIGPGRIDFLLWDLRDGKTVPPPRPRPRHTR